ncbi:MAG: AI-2E family transporter [Acidimicrobiia bacterium]
MDPNKPLPPPVEEGPDEVALAAPSWRVLIRLGALAVGVIVTFQALLKLRGVFLVVAASLVIALGVQPFLKFLERRGLSRGMATTVMLSIGVVVGLGTTWLVAPMLGDQISEVIEAGPGIIDDLRASNGLLDTILADFDMESLAGSDEGSDSPLTSIFGGLFNLFTVGVLTPYFAYAMPRMKVYVLRLIHKDEREDYIGIFGEAVERVSGFIAGNLVVSVFATLFSFAALIIIGVPYAVALAIWIGITDLIPVVGVFIGAAPAIAIAYVELGPGGAIAVAVFIIVYQQIENYLIAPRVMKRTVDLSPPVVIISLMVGGSLAGVLGALLALPVAAVVTLLTNRFLIERRISEVRVRGERQGEGGRQRSLP